MRDCANEGTYHHFLLLACAYRVMAVEVTQSNAAPAAEYLQLFVRIYKQFYDKDSIRFNIHWLLHLPEIALRFGSLTAITAYRFESQIAKLKMLIKSNVNILQQLGQSAK